MSVDALRAWAIKSPKTGLFFGSWSSREEAKREAGMGCMGVDDYHRLGSDKERWEFLHRKGFRIVRVEVKEIAK